MIPCADLFSDSYAVARQRFLKAAQNVDATIKSYLLDRHKGPNEEELAIDIAYLGDISASKLMLISCGTHGLEGQAGGASVLQWLYSEGAKNLPADTAALIVHGVNPWGWAWSSRSNENNVDLNRNFFDHHAHPEKPLYRTFIDRISQNDVSAAGLEASLTAMGAFIAEVGADVAANVLAGGQYDVPDGFNYGGRGKEWSHLAMEQIFDTYVKNKALVYSVEWHTGLGSYAEPFHICQSPRDSEARKLAENCFGAEEIAAGDAPHDAVVDYTGLLLTWMEDRVASYGGTFCGVVIEWGTFDKETVTGALLIDRWLRFECDDRQSAQAIEARTRMREWFSPSALSWRQAVLTKSGPIYQAMLDALAG